MARIGEDISGAIFSPDRLFRYQLWRIWDKKEPLLSFIGFNPSRADEVHNDPTVVNLVWKAKYLGFGGIYIGNLYALVASAPLVVIKKPNAAIGKDNDRYLVDLKKRASIIVLGWGNMGGENIQTRRRCSNVLKLLELQTLYCFKVTKHGQPSHPLYMSDLNLEITEFTSAQKEAIHERAKG